MQTAIVTIAHAPDDLKLLATTCSGGLGVMVCMSCRAAGSVIRQLDEAERRIQALEQLISAARHDVNGALTPALMVADRLRSSSSFSTKSAGERIAGSVQRAVGVLAATREVVPSRQMLLLPRSSRPAGEQTYLRSCCRGGGSDAGWSVLAGSLLLFVCTGRCQERLLAKSCHPGRFSRNSLCNLLKVRQSLFVHSTSQRSRAW